MLFRKAKRKKGTDVETPPDPGGAFKVYFKVKGRAGWHTDAAEYSSKSAAESAASQVFKQWHAAEYWRVPYAGSEYWGEEPVYDDLDDLFAEWNELVKQVQDREDVEGVLKRWEEAGRGAADDEEPQIERDIPELIAALGDENPKVRVQAVDALGEAGDERAIAPLIAALADDDWDVSIQASWALPRLGEAAVGPVIAALTDPDSGVPPDAFRSAGVLESDVAKLADDDPAIRQEAERDFRLLTGFPAAS